MGFLVKSADYTVLVPKSTDEIESFFRRHTFPYTIIPNYSCTIDDIEEPNSNQLSRLHYSTGDDYLGILGEGYRDYELVSIGPNLFDLTFVFLAIIERMRHENGEYSAHSSCARFDEKGIMCIGDRGAGKTSMCVELLSRGGQYISNERTVLKGTTICGGTTGLNDRDGFVGFYDCNSGVQVSLVVKPRVFDHDLETVKYERWREDLSLMTLFKETSNMIRCNGILIGDSVMPSLDSRELSERRLKWAREFVKKVPFYFIEGSPRQITDMVEKLVG